MVTLQGFFRRHRLCIPVPITKRRLCLCVYESEQLSDWIHTQRAPPHNGKVWLDVAVKALIGEPQRMRRLLLTQCDAWYTCITSLKRSAHVSVLTRLDTRGRELGGKPTTVASDV